jgi:hypothetical protein
MGTKGQRLLAMEMDYAETEKGVLPQRGTTNRWAVGPMNYRHDDRSPEQFAKDIKAHTMEERALFLLWLDLVEKETGKRPTYKDTGCGKTGDVLDDKDVSTDPDFEVEGYGLVEIKFSKPLLNKFFHLKTSQVKQYCQKNAMILFVHGTETKSPVFTMLKQDALKSIMKECKIVNWLGFGYKPSYRVPIGKFIWRPLK